MKTWFVQLSEYDVHVTDKEPLNRADWREVSAESCDRARELGWKMKRDRHAAQSKAKFTHDRAVIIR